MFGILNVNKPAGWTSRDVVNRVQRLVKPDKVGHTGTLDPIATGVLVVAIGPATKLIQYSHRLRKSYRATFMLGQSSPSDDTETESELIVDAPIPKRTDLDRVLPGFLGKIDQVPPAFAAVKVKGQRAYRLARRGENLELEPRPVEIHSLRVMGYSYPELVLEIECGSGTYVRSLGRDIAQKLGTAAVMSALERTAIGNMQISDSVHVEELLEGLEKCLIPPFPLVETLRQVHLTEQEIDKLHHGIFAPIEDARILESPKPNTECKEVVGINQVGRIVTILRKTTAGTYQPVCNFPQSS